MWSYLDLVDEAVSLVQLLEAYCEETPVIVDAELHLHSIIASFAAASGRGNLFF